MGVLLCGANGSDSVQRRLVGPLANGLDIVWKERVLHSFRYARLRGGRDRAGGIATRYRLDGPGIESRWRRDFRHLPRQAVRPTQPIIQWIPGVSRG